MPRPRNTPISLRQRLERMRQSGLTAPAAPGPPPDDDALLPLPRRIQHILNIVKNSPQKATAMHYLIMYDIENNKVRRLVSKYLQQQGCIRIQKSVFMAHTEHPKFLAIYETLKDINSFYENADSIMLVPVNVADVRSMKLIGNNVNIEVLTDPRNTYFF